MRKSGSERNIQAHKQANLPVASSSSPTTRGFGKIGIPAVAAALTIRTSHAKMLAKKSSAGR
ncbi:MAG: hypothetical protein KDJ29_18915 [Hyphomicrobiales bacterium]|nr:hypothetical protein [Hyphomicrobiales bacterium]